MANVIQPFHLLVITLAGWLNHHQQAVIDYLIEENRVLKEQLEGQDVNGLWLALILCVQKLAYGFPRLSIK